MPHLTVNQNGKLYPVRRCIWSNASFLI